MVSFLILPNLYFDTFFPGLLLYHYRIAACVLAPSCINLLSNQESWFHFQDY